MESPTVHIQQAGPTFAVTVVGLSEDEAEGLAERIRALVAELEQGPTHADA